MVDGFVQSSVSIKNAIFNRFGDACKLLINDAARADIQVSDLRVSHLPFGKSHRKTACPKADMRIRFKYLIEVRRVCCLDCIAVIGRIQAEAVEYHEHGRADPRRFPRVCLCMWI